MRLMKGCSGMWIAAAAAAIDQSSKAAVRGLRSVRSAAPLWELPGVVAIRPAFNTGAAFSAFSGGGWALTLVTALLIALLAGWLIARPERQPKWARVGLWLIIGGGLGNLYDRIAYGGVTDFIELRFVRFAVFNLADVAICLGAIIAAVALLIDERRKESAHV